MDDTNRDTTTAAIGVGRDRAVFSAHSADGTMLAAEAKGDPAAPEILFIHGLRQSRLSWDKQFGDPMVADHRAAPAADEVETERRSTSSA